MTGVRLHAFPLLFGVCLVGVAPVLAQTRLTLEYAIRRAQGDTADARALASAVLQGLANSLMAGEVASLRLLSRVTVSVLSLMSHQERHAAASSVVPSPAGARS